MPIKENARVSSAWKGNNFATLEQNLTKVIRKRDTCGTNTLRPTNVLRKETSRTMSKVIAVPRAKPVVSELRKERSNRQRFLSKKTYK